MTPLERYRLKNLSIDQLVRWMSRFTEFAGDGYTERLIRRVRDREILSASDKVSSEQVAFNLVDHYQTAVQAAMAKIVVMSSEQAEQFSGIPLFEQDYIQTLRLPFPLLWIDFSMQGTSLAWGPCLAVLLREHSPCDMRVEPTELEWQGMEQKQRDRAATHKRLMDSSARYFVCSAYAPGDKKTIGPIWNNFQIGILVNLDNSISLWPGGDHPALPGFGNWVIHVINFISSPSVLMERKEDNLGHWRSRAASALCGKPVKSSDVHWLLMKKYRTETETKICGYHHRFRYDVRGHFKSFRKGRMAGRVLWCPSHQRGLANEIYRPSHYSGVTGP